VADLVKKKFGVEYKKAQIYNILHSLKFSFQKGKGYYPETEERTEEVVEEIKKNSNPYRVLRTQYK
jgi:transposase